MRARPAGRQFMSKHIVVVGGGQAAAQAVFTLRQRGFDGRLTVVAAEAHLPYQRPPLSKKYLAGEITAERLHLRTEDFYRERDVDLRLGVRASHLRPDRHSLTLANGESLRYDRLLLCTGGRVRRLEVPGTDLPGIHYLRTMEDADRLRTALLPGHRLVIIGGGYIGLEVAAVAVGAGMTVTVLEAGERLMERSVGAGVAGFYRDYHASQGVDVHTRREVVALQSAGRVYSVATRDGTTFECDAVVVGVGIEPNVDLAADAGLSCDNGIAVDQFACTSDPDIVAAGDCTSHPSDLYGRRIRLESVHNAIEQAKVAAHTLLDDRQTYNDVPWFWSDQFDLKLQSAGLAHGHDSTVIRRGDDAKHFAVFYLSDGRLIAVDAVNSPREFMQGRRLIGAGAHPDPDMLADPQVSLSVFDSLGQANV